MYGCVCGVYLKSYCGLGLVQQSIKYAHKCMKWQFHEKENTLCVGRGSKAFVPSTLTQAHTRSTIHPRRGTISLYTNSHTHARRPCIQHIWRQIVYYHAWFNIQWTAMWYIIYETTVVVVIVEVVVALVVAFVVIRLILLVKCSHISIYMSFFLSILSPRWMKPQCTEQHATPIIYDICQLLKEREREETNKIETRMEKTRIIFNLDLAKHAI